MNALEELRQMADLQECGRAFVEIGQLRDIADRIESEWMELPRDKNGEVIHVGDKVSGYEQTGCYVEAVTRVMVVVRSNMMGGHGYPDEPYPLLLWAADDVEIVKPDTWERIEADAAKLPSACEYFGHPMHNCDKCRSNDADDCTTEAARDIVRRCKRLAGFDDE